MAEGCSDNDRAVVSVPNSHGRWEISEGNGRCKGVGCKKNGGGMISIVGVFEVSPGIYQEVPQCLLCGDCFSWFAVATPEGRDSLMEKVAQNA